MTALLIRVRVPRPVPAAGEIVLDGTTPAELLAAAPPAPGPGEFYALIPPAGSGDPGDIVATSPVGHASRPAIGHVDPTGPGHILAA